MYQENNYLLDKFIRKRKICFNFEQTAGLENMLFNQLTGVDRGRRICQCKVNRQD